MLVQWSSARSRAPEVRWGTAAGALGRSTAAESVSYGRDDMCGPPATTVGWLEPGLLHRAVLSDLAPDTEYFYYYGDEVCECAWVVGCGAGVRSERDRGQPLSIAPDSACVVVARPLG